MTDRKGSECRRNAWLASILAGLLLAVALRAVAGYGLMMALWIGGLAALGLGFFFVWSFCTGRAISDHDEDADLARPHDRVPAQPVAEPAPVTIEPQPEPVSAAPETPVAATVPEAPAEAAVKPVAAPLVLTPSHTPAADVPVEPGEDDAEAPGQDLAEDEKAEAAPVAPAKPKAKAKTRVPAARTPRASAKAATERRTSPRPAKPKAAAPSEPKAEKPAAPRASALDAALARTKEAQVPHLQPTMLSAPRGGKADDLKKIKGIGPALEKVLNGIGVWHYDQIAGWKAKDIAFVDSKMEGFRGRITRDEWVKQARILAAGGTTEFAQRVDKGEVY